MPSISIYNNESKSNHYESSNIMLVDRQRSGAGQEWKDCSLFTTAYPYPETRIRFKQLYLHSPRKYRYTSMKPKSIMTTAALIFSTQATTKPTSCSTVSPVTLTFYGWPDNDPPSAEIAYDCGRGYKAGGKHSFAHYSMSMS